MSRTEYHNDPNAPPANSIVPAASAVVVNDDAAVLLHRRSDNDLWSIPGGAMEIGESIADTAVREVKEETGIDVEVAGLVGIYSEPGHVIAYDDGEVRQQFSICFACRIVGGQLAASDESLEVGFFPRGELQALRISGAIRRRIDDHLACRGSPVIA